MWAIHELRTRPSSARRVSDSRRCLPVDRRTPPALTVVTSARFVLAWIDHAVTSGRHMAVNPDRPARGRAGDTMPMIHITDTVAFDEGEIGERFVRAFGPGGINGDRDATAVELRLDIPKSSLPHEVKE